MKVNLGGGLKRFEGFLNADIDPTTNPDILINLENGTFPIEDNLVDEIKAHHIFEHIGEGFFKMMQELYRICKDGAIIDIQVPHHRSEVFYGDCSHIRAITIDNLRQFSKKHNDFHIKTWNSSMGFGNRLNVDFEIVEYNLIPDTIWSQRFTQMTQDEISEVSRNFNNVYNETHIKLMVIKNVD